MTKTSELDEIVKYLDHRHQVLDLFKKIYQGSGLDSILQKFELVVVGGQALALWQHKYFSEDMKVNDFHYSFSDDADFYGTRPSLEYIESRLNIKPLIPDNFNPTVNVGLFVVPNPHFKDGMIVDIIHSVGGIDRDELRRGIEIVNMPDIEMEIPIISPYLCLKSRIHNYFATGYKPDKIKEINRVKFAVDICRAYHGELLDYGRNKDAALLTENIFKLAKSVPGSNLFLNNSVDVLKAIDLNHPGLHARFAQERLPRALVEISDYRERRAAHISRFNPESDKAVDIVKPYAFGKSQNLLDIENLMEKLNSSDLDQKFKVEMLKEFFIKPDEDTPGPGK